ncbi:MAG: hypothetical protein HYX68_29075 [Planctomycetes bacterium]|nr:hypothetical protein [Planctomycetota bacterium]
MSIRAAAFFECDQATWSPERVMTRLEWTLPEAKAIRAYSGPVAIALGGSKLARKRRQFLLNCDREWTRTSNPELESLWFYGPGGLVFIRWKQACEINTTCWWRAFLRDEALRILYVNAFHRIASVFGGTELLVLPTDAKAKDLLWEGASIGQALDALQEQWGDPQSSSEKASSTLHREAEDETPRTWFLEDVRNE